MFQLLHKYVILHGKLSLPEVGVIVLERNSASIDTANKTIINPSWQFRFLNTREKTQADVFAWLAKTMNISVTDAVVELTNFSFGIKNKLNNGEIINWKGIGVFKKSLGDEIKFEPEHLELDFVQPIVAEKVIREKAHHSVRVGDNQRSSEEMERLLNKKESKKSGAWVFTFIASLVAISFLAIYFVKNDMEFSAFRNQQKIIPQELPAMLK